MPTYQPPILHDFQKAAATEWVQTNGVGGVAASSIIGANTRKQHAILSVPDESERRIVLVANLQETVADPGRSCDLSTNAYVGAIHPAGYMALESFAIDPWPTWVYRFDGLANAAGAMLEKQLIMIHGEHTVVIVYRLIGGERPVSLTVRPLLAFRDHNSVMLERGRNASNWQATTEFIECCPFPAAPTLFIAHPNAKIETVGLWYRGFIYHRDQEVHLDCIEDLFNPGSLEISLPPNISRCLVFSTPSPRPVEIAGEYIKNESARRRQVATTPPNHQDDPFLRQLLAAADSFVYERLDGSTGIHPGLPWGECELYRGLLAFPGLFLVNRQFDAARKYLDRLAALWQEAQAPSAFCTHSVPGQMHVADVPLWLFIAAWKYWKASRDDQYAYDTLLPLLRQIAEYYLAGAELHHTDDLLLEVGHEPGAAYQPHLPLGTNALWFNAQMILSEMMRQNDRPRAAQWHGSAQVMVESLRRMFACERRGGLADSVKLDGLWRDETLHSSQILAVGLPYLVAAEPASVIRLVEKHLLTPFGLRTLSPEDSRYVGDGMDVKVLPKFWSGSVDATWIGCYCDAVKRIGRFVAAPELFAPFSAELECRGVGHVSGAFTGNAPHEPCDYVASASAVAEILRAYARHVLRLPDVP
jgi:predicted glycogen debranching enzyme